MKATAILLCAALSGCATIEQNLGTPDAFAKCAAVDVAATAYGLSTNKIHEINPLTKALTIHGIGRVAGTIIPVIGLSIAAYYLLKYVDNPQLTAGAAVVTCAAGARDLYLAR